MPVKETAGKPCCSARCPWEPPAEASLEATDRTVLHVAMKKPCLTPSADAFVKSHAFSGAACAAFGGSLTKQKALPSSFCLSFKGMALLRRRHVASMHFDVLPQPTESAAESISMRRRIYF